MITKFELSKNDDSQYMHKIQINDDYYVHYDNEQILYEFKADNTYFLLYGYAFDVRHPEQDINKTLEFLSKSSNIQESLDFLNGQFYLVYKENDNFYFTSDAVCISPIYIDVENHRLTTEGNETFKRYNSHIRVHLNTWVYERTPESPVQMTNTELEHFVVEHVKEQYRYFLGRSLAINFRTNMMNKSTLALLSPAMYEKEIYVRHDTEINNRVAQWMEQEFRMALVSYGEKIQSDYLTNSHLMDFERFLTDRLPEDEAELDEFKTKYELNDASLRTIIVEYNLLNHLRYHKDAKPQFVFDPFNVRIIQNNIYRFDQDDSFKPLNRITQHLKPMLNFYDFSTGKTLQQKYKSASKDKEALKKELVSSVKNYEFVQSLKKQGINISVNLDGSFEDNILVVQPLSTEISKDDVFTVTYEKSKPGMMIVETFFDNPRNAHRIKVTVNGETGDVSNYLHGKFLNVEDKLEILMQYERDYNAPSWQKAGKIKISEID